MFQEEFILEILEAFTENRSSSRATAGFSWGNSTVQLREMQSQEGRKLQLTGSTEKASMVLRALSVGAATSFTVPQVGVEV